MAIADLTRVKKRVIQILGANRAAYSAGVGTGNSGIGAYRNDDEISDACFEADSMVIVQGYFASRLSLRNRFFKTSSPLAHGDPLPEFAGLIGTVEYTADGTNWRQSMAAASKQDIIALARPGTATYVGAGSSAGHHFIEDGAIYHTSKQVRVKYPEYNRTTSALQSYVAHEPAIISGALMLLYKESSQHAADYYAGIFSAQIEAIRAGALQLAPAQTL